ncbi:MAG: pilus assembly protein PilB, partial [Acidobacteriota bacterium]
VDVLGRFLNMNVDLYNFVSALNCILAQRLVRKICESCKIERFLTQEEAEALQLAVPDGKRIKVYEGGGCFECRHTGYQGRSGIFEILRVDEKIKELINNQADVQLIKREAARLGMKTLRQAALRKLADGVTTYEEVVRVTAL